MLEPLKIGLPIGFVFFGAFCGQLYFELPEYTLARWFGISGIGAIIIFLFYKPKLGNELSFRNIWFSGFSALVTAVLCNSALTVIFQTPISKQLKLVDGQVVIPLIIYEFNQHIDLWYTRSFDVSVYSI